MPETIFQKHWYDGWFYAFFIDTKLNDFRERLYRFVTPQSYILDVGCGTGGFALKLAQHCAHVTGIDVSEKQIQMANKRLERSSAKNVDFIHADARNITELLDRTYDSAFFSFVIHEMPHQTRLSVLRSVAQLATQLVILDYNTPHPFSVFGITTRVVEFLAGREHFNNFKDYLYRNGMDGILDDLHLSSHMKLVNRKKIFRTDLVKSD